MSWLPHTSSIDFCEDNYKVTDAIVEFHNCWSSFLGLSCFGLLGFMKNDVTNEKRNKLAYLILFFIGLGSAGLHGTLHWVFQSSDELPMIYMVTVMNFMAVEANSARGVSKYPYLPTILTFVMIAETLIYYKLQQFYSVFIFTYTLFTLFHFYLMYNLVIKEKKGGSISNKLWKYHHIAYTGSFLFCWLPDMLHCDVVNVLPTGFTLHVFWHIGAGFGAYCGVIILELIRCEALSIPIELSFLFGCIPYLREEKSRRD